MKTQVMIMLFMLAVLSASAVQAQPGHGTFQLAAAEPYPGDGPDDALSPEKREETRRKIESLRIWRMTEALKLDPATSAKLASLLSSLDQQRSKVQREQRETMWSLRQLLKELRPDEAKLKSALESLEKNHRAMQELRNKELNDLKGLLTIEQQARFLLFQQEFMRELRSMIEDARGMGPGRGGMGGGRMRGGPGGPPDN